MNYHYNLINRYKWIIDSGCIKNGVKTAPQPIPAAGQGNIPKSIMVNAGHPEFTAGAG